MQNIFTGGFQLEILWMDSGAFLDTIIYSNINKNPRIHLTQSEGENS